MQTRDAIKLTLKSTHDLLNSYLSDLSDQDILVRPVPAANHIAWQLGHLIVSETMMGGQVPAAKYPEVPASVASIYADRKGTAPATGYLKKAEYLDLFGKIRAATIAAVDKMADADFDKATSGPMAQWAPTLGALLLLTGNHTLMHAGQFTVVRRALNKPILF